MGWASGTWVMQDIIVTLMSEIKCPDKRQRIYKGIIKALQGNDWDTQTECLDVDPAFDAALKELHPDWFEDEQDL